MFHVPVHAQYSFVFFMIGSFTLWWINLNKISLYIDFVIEDKKEYRW